MAFLDETGLTYFWGKVKGWVNNSQHPVGSIYLSTSQTFNPQTAWGGTWKKIADGRCLIGASDAYPLGSTGGEATHKLTTAEMPSHNHSFSGSGTTGANNRGHTHSYTKATGVQGHTLTVNEMPNHSHITNPLGYVQHISIGNGYNTAVTDGYGNRAEVSTTATGGGASHSHGLSTASTDSGAESQNHTHSFSYSGTTGNSGSGNAHNNMQPYLAVYIWERTA